MAKLGVPASVNHCLVRTGFVTESLFTACGLQRVLCNVRLIILDTISHHQKPTTCTHHGTFPLHKAPSEEMENDAD